MTTDLQVVPLPLDPVGEFVPKRKVEIEALGLISAIVDHLGELVTEHCDDIEGLARTQLLAAKAKKQFDLLIEIIRPHLVKAMGSAKQIDIADLGRLERKTAVTMSEWDHETVRARVRLAALQRAFPDGEIDASTMEAIDQTLELVWSVQGKSAYRAGGIRDELGLSPDEVAKSSYGKTSVVIKGSK